MLKPNRHFSPFKLFLDRESRTALMLNPKVLTTFTRQWLTDGYRDHRGLADPSNGRLRFLSVPRRFPMAPLRDYWAFIRDPAAFETFAFVRNPYGRLASAWKNKFLDGHHRSPDGADAAYARSMRKHELPPLRAFARAQGLPGGAPNTLIPFETFLRYAASQPEGQRDHHWDSQSTVLMCDRLRYARIFRIEEEKEEGFLTLGRRLGFPEDWVLARMDRRPNSSKRAAETYTPALADLARGLIGQDLTRFGYDPESWRDF
ncbi:Sulfotransferase family protein [Gemmobacter aquatilis]|uniref:Sulfotransferase family protein n=1 Tax=Gemmobacter aquatilis TaxID=933059 RepID=A0A1H8JTE2_9RHOB|nr:sulfotransferase family 2 domain-containing protein [Gemmobacter aquatilis]SEN83468.1 Sulfotransferase family protein [Gemmobacter aquatilis]